MSAINVTALHIARGERENCERCPVALAIMDALPRAGVPAVNSDHVTFSAPADSWIDVMLPPAAVEFIEAFDSDDDDAIVQPFTFELDYPEARPAA